LWSALLRALPETKMILAGMPADGEQAQLIEQFAANGVARERLTFHGRRGMEEYLELHHRMDICLDTYPYTGGTTTYHALWMGVPTLTVAGPTPAARQGAAIMGQVGLDGFTAADDADFVEKGIYWANHPDALAGVRARLREQCRQSPVLQPHLIVDALERALRQMWQRWCAGLPPESFEITLPESVRQ
jgi:predicted O-linked N-acetylglucosamine transferase (SPINDLY family)